MTPPNQPIIEVRGLLEPPALVLERLRGVDGPVVDIGAGGGALAARLAEAGHTVSAVDPMPPARTEHPVLRGTADALPLASDSQAAAIFHWSLHHVPIDAIGAALSEARRVLRPGGQLLIAEPQASGSWYTVLHHFHNEDTVRAAAQHALRAQLPPHFRQWRRIDYRCEHRFADFERFAEHMLGLGYNHYGEAEVRAPAVRAAFALTREAGGHRLDQRVTLDCFEGLLTPA